MTFMIILLTKTAIINTVDKNKFVLYLTNFIAGGEKSNGK